MITGAVRRSCRTRCSKRAASGQTPGASMMGRIDDLAEHILQLGRAAQLLGELQAVCHHQVDRAQSAHRADGPIHRLCPGLPVACRGVQPRIVEQILQHAAIVAEQRAELLPNSPDRIVRQIGRHGLSALWFVPRMLMMKVRPAVRAARTAATTRSKNSGVNISLSGSMPGCDTWMRTESAPSRRISLNSSGKYLRNAIIQNGLCP